MRLTARKAALQWKHVCGRNPYRRKMAGGRHVKNPRVAAWIFAICHKYSKNAFCHSQSVSRPILFLCHPASLKISNNQRLRFFDFFHEKQLTVSPVTCPRHASTAKIVSIARSSREIVFLFEANDENQFHQKQRTHEARGTIPDQFWHKILLPFFFRFRNRESNCHYPSHHHAIIVIKKSWRKNQKIIKMPLAAMSPSIRHKENVLRTAS